MTFWPVFIVGDDIKSLTFDVAIKEPKSYEPYENIGEDNLPNIREDISCIYSAVEIRQRLHQRGFRERVLAAYRSQCALCRLNHAELLDAAHIVSDRDEKGAPTVSNGLALCKLHHAAFDRFIFGITPDYEVKVRKDILKETDGPMLLHGLQNINKQSIYVPEKRSYQPDRELLGIRYAQFEAFAGK